MTSITPLASTPSLSPIVAARSVGTNDTSPAPPGSSQPSAGTSSAAGSFSTSVDPALGITVLKFFSSAGDLTQSFPSQKQLASYQLYGLDKGNGASTSAGTPKDAADATTTDPAPAAGSAVAAPKVPAPVPVPVPVVASSAAPVAPREAAAAAA